MEKRQWMRWLYRGVWTAVWGGCALMAEAQTGNDGQPVTLKEKIEMLQTQYGVNFVYDSSLRLDAPCGQGASLDGFSLEKVLEQLLTPAGIAWKRQREYVMLYPAEKKRAHYSVSGYVYQENGEPLINATVYDLFTGKGTLTNAYGFFSLTLPEGVRKLRFSFVGCEEQVQEIDLHRHRPLTVTLKQSLQLEEVVIKADLNNPLATTQTGKVTLTPSQLNTEYALFSSPDLVKTLQNQAGVAAGMELISGMYVHGGTNDGNLFLLDGTPLYQVSHWGGLFSAFNTDIVKNVDFYKSGFPARYGGRLSSVTDVRTKEGDMKEFHGTFSLGLLDGRIQLEGPIVKNRTSFNIAMRRSWMELMTLPACAIIDKMSTDGMEQTHTNYRFAFHDVNAKLTHRFSDRSKLSWSLYSGTDLFKTDVNQHFDHFMDGSSENDYRTDLYLRWGNLTSALNWSYQFSPRLFANFTAVYAQNRSRYSYVEDNRDYREGKPAGMYRWERSNRSSVQDAGYRMEFDYRPLPSHHIRFGSDFLHHRFHPQHNASTDVSSDFVDGAVLDTLRSGLSKQYRGNELTLYAEDDIRLSSRWQMNVGLHYALFQTEGKVYHSAEPRVALRYRVSDRMSLKASYTEMSQFVQQIPTTYLNLPTDYWVPATRKVRPLRARQWAAGVYGTTSWGLSGAVEGYYKTMDHLLEYAGNYQLAPSVEDWEQKVHAGRGRAYGMELTAAYAGARVSVEGAYTLSWSERRFEVYGNGWYPDKFDNRHKLNLTLRYRFNNRIEAYAGWTYHTGNRITLPTHWVEAPALPGVSGEGNTGYTGGWIASEPSGEWVYERPNNARLPAYHRLDVGVNFRRITKRGFERIWNISFYNVYCRMNAMAVKYEPIEGGGFKARATGVFPFIPSFSYTLKF